MQVVYSGYMLAELLITIVDDDTAGVNISATTVAATMDNYGDALDEGRYAVRLDSEPLGTVTVSLGGLGSWATASPTTLTFTPTDWAAAQEVTVATAAASASRPVCPSGKLRCDALEDRVETITHAVSSAADGGYDVLSIEDVTVVAKVTYDTQVAPTIASCRFADALNSVMIMFDGGTDKAGIAGSVDCGTVLDGTTATDAFLGSGASCSFPAADKLLITFGTAATILVGDKLALSESVLKSNGPVASLFAHHQNTTVGIPDNPTYPLVAIASPDTLGLCDDMVLDGMKHL